VPIPNFLPLLVIVHISITKHQSFFTRLPHPINNITLLSRYRIFDKDCNATTLAGMRISEGRQYCRFEERDAWESWLS